jgi:hypothetical protein
MMICLSETLARKERNGLGSQDLYITTLLFYSTLYHRSQVSYFSHLAKSEIRRFLGGGRCPAETEGSVLADPIGSPEKSSGSILLEDPPSF